MFSKNSKAYSVYLLFRFVYSLAALYGLLLQTLTVIPCGFFLSVLFTHNLQKLLSSLSV